jgi:hypothetical protein
MTAVVTPVSALQMAGRVDGVEVEGDLNAKTRGWSKAR